MLAHMSLEADVTSKGLTG